MKTKIMLAFLLITLYSCTKMADTKADLSAVTIEKFDSLAKGGATITIKGSGFSTNLADNHVTINSKVATVNAATDTTLLVTVPSKAGSGKIIVTVGISTATSLVDFTYDWIAVVSTLTGSSAGFQDGDLANAKFKEPTSLAVDANDNIYVGDYGNFRIRKITPAGIVSTIAGNGTQGIHDGIGTAAQIGSPMGITTDKNNNVYFTEYFYSIIRKISPDGTVVKIAGRNDREYPYWGFENGPADSAIFDDLYGIVADKNGNLMIGDNGNHQVRKLSSGVVSTLAGNNMVGLVDAQGTSAQFCLVRHLAIDAQDNTYVVDYCNKAIRKIDPSGMVSTLAVGDGNHSKDENGSFIQFEELNGITVDQEGNIYISDVTDYLTKKHLIRKITPSGKVSIIAGGNQGSVDGIATAASFNDPRGLAVDSHGNIYVADKDNHRIRKITFE